MKTARGRATGLDAEPVRVLGRGLRAQRGVHLTLRAVREAVGKTQVDVAGLTEIDQADISRLERRSDLGDIQIATLRRYVKALGGSFELVASFGDKKIILVGAGSETAVQHAVAPAEAGRDRQSPTKRRARAPRQSSSSGVGRLRR